MYHHHPTQLSLFNLLAVLLLFCMATACTSDDAQDSRLANYYLGWRMIESMKDDRLPTAQAQYDSLRRSGFGNLGPVVVQSALMLQLMTGDKAEALWVLKQLPEDRAAALCETGLFGTAPICATLPKKAAVAHPEWRRRLRVHYLRDQGARGNLKRNLASELSVDTTNWRNWRNLDVDGDGRVLLREYIDQHGFPTVAQIGERGMHAVFFIIQHADQDPVWQAAQLPALTDAFKNGDISGEDLAYVTDRIRVNAGQRQLYGTQLMVDPEEGTVRLKPLADSLDLDRRRMEMHMMPIANYLRSVKSTASPH